MLAKKITVNGLPDGIGPLALTLKILPDLIPILCGGVSSETECLSGRKVIHDTAKYNGTPYILVTTSKGKPKNHWSSFHDTKGFKYDSML
jgi:hypothetical protein